MDHRKPSLVISLLSMFCILFVLVCLKYSVIENHLSWEIRGKKEVG